MNAFAFWKLPSLRRWFGLLLPLLSFSFWTKIHVSRALYLYTVELRRHAPVHYNSGSRTFDFLGWMILALLSSGLLFATFWCARNGAEVQANELLGFLDFYWAT